MTDTMLAMPDDLEEARETITNIDGGAVPPGVEDDLRAGKWAQHCAWDHWGEVWFADGKFHEKVMRYQRNVGTITPEIKKYLQSEFARDLYL